MFHRPIGHGGVNRVLGDACGHRLTSACAEQAGVEQRIAAQTIRAMYRDTRAFASGEQSIDYLHGTIAQRYTSPSVVMGMPPIV